MEMCPVRHRDSSSAMTRQRTQFCNYETVSAVTGHANMQTFAHPQLVAVACRVMMTLRNGRRDDDNTA
jgi:hypothetical protein